MEFNKTNYNENNQNADYKPPKMGFVRRFIQYNADCIVEHWKIFMFIVTFIGAVFLVFANPLGAKAVGAILLVWGIWEIKQLKKAKEAGVFYYPLMAKFIVWLLLGLIIILIIIFLMSNSPIARVKEMTFNNYDHSVKTILTESYDSVEWRSSTNGNITSVIAECRNEDDHTAIWFEFEYREYDDEYWVELVDMWDTDYTYGGSVASMTLAALDSNI